MNCTTQWCDACRKFVTLETGSECGLDPNDTSFDDYIAATASMPCAKAVVVAGRLRQAELRESTNTEASSS